MHPIMHIRLLGDFCLSLGNETVTGVKTTRLQSLLAYLVLHHDLPQSRQRLAFLFWPETPEDQARNNLRNLLYFLRHSLPDSEDYLLVDMQTIQWNPQASFTLDVDQFIRASTNPRTHGDLQQAIQLYSGDLLPNCYDDWIQPERERLRELFISTLERLIQLLENERDYSQAISYTRRLLRLEPLREETHHRLTRLYASNGDHAMAMHTYHSFVTMLERELGVEPGPEFQAVYKRLIKAGEKPLTKRLSGAYPLIGRQREWAILQSAWRNTVYGEARFVLVTGEAGIGKTRLVEEMIDWAERLGIMTAKAHCFAAEENLSYAPISAWLRSHPLPTLEELWLSEVARLLPEVLIEHPELPSPEPLTESWQRLRLFKALGFAILKDRTDLILLIEDLEWIDRETLEWIAYIMQAQEDMASKTRLLVIGTLRVEETAENYILETFQNDLQRAGKITEIKLGSLSETETTALARAVIGEEVDSVWGSRLYQETEGNPLFVVEMVRSGILENHERSPIAADEIKPLQESLPEKVRQVIETRLAKLSKNAQELAEVAAVVGREFSYRILSLASNLEEEKLLNALDELWRKRIIGERGKDGYEFSHDKIRQVAYVHMSDTRRRFCHRRVAEALETLHAKNLEPIYEQLATHYEIADGIDKAIHFYQLAAQTAQRLFANQESIQLLHKGLKLFERLEFHNLPSDLLKDRQCLYYENLGDTYFRIGAYDDACFNHQQALALLAGSDGFSQARLNRKLGNDFREKVIYDQALIAYQKAQDLIDLPSTGSSPASWWEWIELQLDHSLIYFYLSRQDDVQQIVERLRSVVEQHATATQLGRYYRRLVAIKFRQNRFNVDEETIDLSRNALAMIKASGDLVEIASAHFGLGLALIWYGNLDEAENQIHAAIDVAKQTGQNILPVCYGYLTIVHRKRGDIASATSCAQRVLELTTKQTNPIYYAMGLSTLAWIAWRNHQWNEAETQARQALAIWQELPDAFAFCWVALWPLIGALIAQDRLAEAITATQALFDPHQQLPPPTLETILNAAIKSWDLHNLSETRTFLRQAIDLAGNSGYL